VEGAVRIAFGGRRRLHEVYGAEWCTCCLVDNGFRDGGGAEKVVFGRCLIMSRFQGGR
jgi:hypothetical protein